MSVYESKVINMGQSARTFAPVVAGISSQQRDRLVRQLGELPVSQAVLTQYAYHVCRSLEVWARMLEFRMDSKCYDDATLGYTRLVNLLKGADAECFPVLEEVVPALEAACCYLYRLSGTDRLLTARLLPVLEEAMFNRSELRLALAEHGAAYPALAKLIQKYWELSDLFFAGVEGMWAGAAIDGLPGKGDTSAKAHANILELAELFAADLVQGAAAN